MKYILLVVSVFFNTVSFAVDTSAGSPPIDSPTGSPPIDSPAGHPPIDSPAGHPPIDHKAMMGQIGQGESDGELDTQGKAVSVLPVKGYVYIEVAPDEGEKVWLAVPEEVTVKEGDTVLYKTGPVMTDFKSKSLDRTFSSVMFLPRVIINSDTK